MKCSFFSDLHIKSPGDDATKLFVAFCKSSEVQDSDTVILLGDMFDILIGEHKQYLQKYETFFSHLIQLLNSDKKIVFLEGNHDFHIKRTIEKFVKKNSAKSKNFKYLIDGESIVLNNKTYYYCHGDEVDYYNKYFKRWKRIYTSSPFKILVNYILPYFILDKLAHSASKDSKRRGKKVFNYDEAKKKYLVGAKALIDERKVDGVISGHTHIQEIHEYPDKTLYVNCGFPLKDKNFIHFNGNDFVKISLVDSSH